MRPHMIPIIITRSYEWREKIANMRRTRDNACRSRCASEHIPLSAHGCVVCEFAAVETFPGQVKAKLHDANKLYNISILRI